MIKIQSNDKKNLIVHVVVFLIGLLFIYLTSRAENPMTDDLQAAYLLGLLLAGLGGFCLVYQQSYLTTIDPVQKAVIHLGRNTFFGVSRQIVPFSEVARIDVHYIGDYDSRSYHLKIVLKNNQELQTGKWSSDEEEMKLLAREIAEVIRCDHPAVPLPTSIAREIENALYALFIIFALYAVYYRIQIGSFTKGMWFGSFPGFFIILGWLSVYQIIRRLRKQYAAKN
jgi:hypothetical protein